MRPGKPYPATFRMSVDPPGIEPGFPACRAGVVPLDHEPIDSVDLMGVEPITPILQGSVASIGMQAQLQRSARELNPILVLTTDVCCRNTYRPFLSSDPGWNRTSTFLDVGQASSPLDHGIVSDRGGSRTHKIIRLST